MKWNSYLAGVVVLGLVSITARAVPVYESNEGGEYLISYQGLDRWGAGFLFSSWDRSVQIQGGGITLENRLDVDRLTGYLSYHLLRTLDVYVAGGSADAEVGKTGERKSASSDYALGLRINILDHIIKDPILLEDKIRLTASAQYSETKVDDLWIGGVGTARRTSWREKYGALNLAIINDVEGMVMFHPESIALNLGLIYHKLDGTLAFDDPRIEADRIEAKNPTYFSAGVELFWTKRLSMEAAMLMGGGETKGTVAAIHLRF